MVQCANPISDVATTNWAEGAGDGDGDAFDELDEGIVCSGSPDDITTYWLTTDETSNTLTCGLQTVTDPALSTGHVFRVRARKNASAGRQLDLDSFLQDPDFIAAIDVDGLSATWTTHSLSLSGAEADLIDAYGNLRIFAQIIETGGGSPRVGWCSTMEFECPDAVADQEVLHRPKLAGSLLTRGSVI